MASLSMAKSLRNKRSAGELRAWFAARIKASLFVRPWLADIGCGSSAAFWGVWVGAHHEQVALHGGFAVFGPIIRQLAVVAFILGISQLIAALLKLNKTRQAVALFGLILWSGIAMGVTAYSGQAAYTGYALFNALILTRRF